MSSRSYREQGPASHEENNPPSSPTVQRLFDQVKSRITTATGPYCCFHLDGIAPKVGYQVACRLSEDEDVERCSPRMTYNPIVHGFSFTMTSHIGSCVATWAAQEKANARASGFFTRDESIDLQMVPGSRFHRFPPPWSQSYKEPDVAFIFDADRMPCVVLETSFMESWPKLQDDKDLWLQGGAPHVNAILLVKWDKRSDGKVAGYLEIHRGGSATSHRVEIFPAPEPGAPAQDISFYRRDFYPFGVVPDGRNGDDIWTWDIDLLRMNVTRAMAREGLRPA